jgi:hypothetical protein
MEVHEERTSDGRLVPGPIRGIRIVKHLILAMSTTALPASPKVDVNSTKDYQRRLGLF